MLDELLEIFERDRRGEHKGEKPKGIRARLARLFGGHDRDDDAHDGDHREVDARGRRDRGGRRERDDRFDWGDD